MKNASEWSKQEDPIDLRVLFATVWERRWWIYASVVVSTVAFTSAAFLMTPIYRATTVLISASADRGSTGSLGSALGQFGGLASLAGVSVGSPDSTTEEALAVLRSRQFTEQFISDLDLMPSLFPKLWDISSGKWKVTESSRPTYAKAYRVFDGKIRSIVQDKKTSLITLQIDWPDRNKATFWANELVRRLNSEMRERAVAKATASLGYLEKELSSTSEVGTRDAVNRLIETQVKQRMLANVTQEYAFRVVDKAMVPDEDDPVEPQKLRLIVAGPFVGLLFGFALAVALMALQPKAKTNPLT